MPCRGPLPVVRAGGAAGMGVSAEVAFAALAGLIPASEYCRKAARWVTGALLGPPACPAALG